MGYSCFLTIARRIWVFILVGLLFIIVGLIFAVYGGVKYESKEETKIKQKQTYGIAVDAGGSKTKLYFYRSKDNKQLVVTSSITCEDEGVATYLPSQYPVLKQRLGKCLEDARAKVPSAKIPVFVRATAGMRLLRLENQTRYSEILSLVNDVLESSLFSGTFQTLTGAEEAQYAWTAVNLLKQESGTQDNYGIAELGSTSLQLAFAAKEDPDAKESFQYIQINGENVSVYGHSYLCFGRKEMERRIMAKLVENTANLTLTINNPCNFKGFKKNLTGSFLYCSQCVIGDYANKVLGQNFTKKEDLMVSSVGTGNSSECMKLIKSLLIPESTRCKTSRKCGINNLFQPQVQGNFYALSVFSYGTSFMNVGSNIKENDYKKEAAKLCNSTWDEIKNRDVPGTPVKYRPGRCLDVSLTYLLLTEGFKFNDETWKIVFTEKIDGKEVSWTLGMLQKEKENLWTHESTKSILLITRRTTMMILLVVGVILIVIGLVLLGLVLLIKRKYSKVPTEGETLD